MYFFWISLNKLNLNLFWTAAHWFFFLTTCHALKTWFKLLRVKSVYRNDLKGNKNYFEFAGGSGYRAFELPEGKITGNHEYINLSKKFRGNRFWFELARGWVSEGSGYRESTVISHRRESFLSWVWLSSLLSETDTNILDRDGPRGWWPVRHAWVRLIEDRGGSR